MKNQSSEIIMSSGRCLCGCVTWEITGKPEDSTHCHCSMCRKVHGAPYGTYHTMKKENFSWTSNLDTVKQYVSSASITRAFCRICGSAVPDSDSDEIYVTAGSHDDGPPIEAHIFVRSKAPWHDITDSLPCHDGYPSAESLPEYDDKIISPPKPGIIRGSCLCDAVAFEISEPFKRAFNCHCSRCRQARAATHTTNGFVEIDAVQFIRGEDHVANYKVPDAQFFTHAFCDTCGSGMPRLDTGRNIAVVPFGSLDDDPGCKPSRNIFVADKANWYEITGDLPCDEQGPPA